MCVRVFQFLFVNSLFTIKNRDCSYIYVCLLCNYQDNNLLQDQSSEEFQILDAIATIYLKDYANGEGSRIGAKRA